LHPPPLELLELLELPELPLLELLEVPPLLLVVLPDDVLLAVEPLLLVVPLPAVLEEPVEPPVPEEPEFVPVPFDDEVAPPLLPEAPPSSESVPESARRHPAVLAVPLHPTITIATIRHAPF
jgi:hypothetical protein